MTPIQSTFLIIFGILAYMIIVDENVAKYIMLWVAIIKVNTERIIWMIRFHPNNFVTTWLQNRKYAKIAKELQEEFLSKSDE